MRVIQGSNKGDTLLEPFLYQYYNSCCSPRFSMIYVFYLALDGFDNRTSAVALATADLFEFTVGNGDLSTGLNVSMKRCKSDILIKRFPPQRVLGKICPRIGFCVQRVTVPT